MFEMGISGIDLTVSALLAHNMGVLTVNPSVSMVRTVVAQANAETVIDSVALFATPHAFPRHMGMGFGDMVLNGHADLMDPHFGEGGGNVKGRVYVMLETSQGVGSGEAG